MSFLSSRASLFLAVVCFVLTFSCVSSCSISFRRSCLSLTANNSSSAISRCSAFMPFSSRLLRSSKRSRVVGPVREGGSSEASTKPIAPLGIARPPQNWNRSCSISFSARWSRPCGRSGFSGFVASISALIWASGFLPGSGWRQYLGSSGSKFETGWRGTRTGARCGHGFRAAAFGSHFFAGLGIRGYETSAAALLCPQPL
mmetsp:Transcript_26253/g.56963  ORF Transcript_26253/g.56963 Transcript_26253/m.56963 type:complete len:201 (-) Transcript_26253:1521-2123(-)